MEYSRKILHPTETDFLKSGYFYYGDFYFAECVVGYLYEKYMNHFIENGLFFNKREDNKKNILNLEYQPNIIKFDNDNIYTSETYKFTFRHYDNFILDFKKAKIFGNLFLIPGWENEYESNYGDITKHVKPWVDYLTYQGYRTILQFRFDNYLVTEERKEKLNKILI